MSSPEQRTPRKRVVSTITWGKTSTRIDARGRALTQASTRERVPPQAGTRGGALGDPRLDGIIQALEISGNMISQ